MKSIYQKCIATLKRNKWIVALIPIYMVYYLAVYVYLGIGDDIWDKAVGKINS